MFRARCRPGYHRNAERILEPDPVTAPIVHELFVQRGAEVSWTQPARFLEEKVSSPPRTTRTGPIPRGPGG